jgi:hypothetical protein
VIEQEVEARLHRVVFGAIRRAERLDLVVRELEIGEVEPAAVEAGESRGARPSEPFLTGALKLTSE